MNARDELFQLILGRTTTKAVERILAAGYVKPRTVTTVEELDALPVGAVVRSDIGVVYEKDAYFNEPDNPFWTSVGDAHQYASRRISFPATVLFEGEA
jgi:hypothetical protein